MKSGQSKNAVLVALATYMFAFFGNGSAIAQTANTVSVGLQGRPLQQVALTTRDLERAKVFYGTILGLPYLFESNGMAFFDVAGLRLMVALDENRPEGQPTSVLYFDVEDFHAAADRLKRADVELDGPIETVQKTKAGKLKIQQFHDPDGNALAIIGFVES